MRFYLCLYQTINGQVFLLLFKYTIFCFKIQGRYGSLMLTAYEILMAGNPYNAGEKVITYLTIPSHNYTFLSPYSFSNDRAGMFSVDYGGLASDRIGSSGAGVRLSISLNNGIQLTNGDGSLKKAYKIS